MNDTGSWEPLVLDYMIWYSCIKNRRVGIPLTDLSLPHFCSCPKTRPELHISYVMVFFFMFNEWRGEIIVSFVENCWQSLFKLSFHNIFWSFAYTYYWEWLWTARTDFTLYHLTICKRKLNSWLDCYNEKYTVWLLYKYTYSM